MLCYVKDNDNILIVGCLSWACRSLVILAACILDSSPRATGDPLEGKPATQSQLESDVRSILDQLVLAAEVGSQILPLWGWSCLLACGQLFEKAP